jgi:hypothetical protein
MNKKWIVTSYRHDISWIDSYTDNYLIYDKSNELIETDKIKHQKNVGRNIYDTFHYIVNNYENLPDICVFIKGNIFNRMWLDSPAPHCKEEKFKKLINNNFFTPLESYDDLPESPVHIKGEDDGYCELATPEGCWPKVKQKYFKTYNEFLDIMFINPDHPKWIRFAPGGNYIVPKDRILFYSKLFYEKLMNYVDIDYEISDESHIIERALYTIWQNKYKEKL